jgi:DNA-directed RNA polymerase subunit RPC12/RpoP
MEKAKKHTGKCFDCGGPLELVELDIQKGTKVMRCQECGLLHFYRKDFFGAWKLLKVTKNA